MKKILISLLASLLVGVGCSGNREPLPVDKFNQENPIMRVIPVRGGSFQVEDIDGDGFADYLGPAEKSFSARFDMPAYVTREAAESLKMKIDGKYVMEMDIVLRDEATKLLKSARSCAYRFYKE